MDAGIEARGLCPPDSRPKRGASREKKDVKGNEPKLDRKQRKTRGTNPIEPINEAIDESDKTSIMSKLSRFPSQSQVIDLESMDYGLSATGIGFVQAVFQKNHGSR